MQTIGRFAVRWRYVVVVLWLLATAVAITRLPSLSSVANTDNSAFLSATSPSVHANHLAQPFMPAHRLIGTIVGSRSDGPLTTADQAAISSLDTQAAVLPHVVTVRDQGVSRDGKARKAQVVVDAKPSSTEAKDAVNSIRGEIAAAKLPAGLTVSLTGTLAVGVDNQKASDKAQRLTNIGSYLIIVVMLLLVFRAVVAPIVTMLPAVLALLIAGPLIAQLSQSGIQVSGITQVILIVLMLGAGTDYGLFITLRTREEMQTGRMPRDAVIEAVHRIGESITFSAATVIAALLSLLLASFGIYHDLGPALAIGVAVMLLAALTLLPALLAIAGPLLFWPSTIGAHVTEANSWGRIAAGIVRRPKRTLLIGALFFGALALGVLGYAPGGFASGSSGPSGSDSAKGAAAIAAHYPPAVAKPTNVLLVFPHSVWTDLNTAYTAEQQLSSQSVFKQVNGLFDPNGKSLSPTQLSQLYSALGPPAALPATPPASSPVPAQTYAFYRSIAQFVSPDGKTLLFYTTLAAGDPTSTTALQAIPSVRSAVASVAHRTGAVDSGVSGVASSSYDVSGESDSDLLRILPVVLVLIAVLLGVVMRSMVAPLYLVASVALSYLAALGLAALIFMKIGGDAGLNFVLPFLMFVFLMALGEDYNILVMSRIREEAEQRPLSQAVARALGATGSTVTSAGMILAATFAVAGTVASTDQVRQLGWGIALGVLMDTFLVRTLLVPSVVALLGRWNWWPSSLARRNAESYPAEDGALPEETKLAEA